MTYTTSKQESASTTMLQTTADGTASYTLTPEIMKMLQDAGLDARRKLFWKEEYNGFDYNGIISAPNAIREEEESRVNKLTGGFVRFNFVSHSTLSFCFDGYDKNFVFSSTKSMQNIKVKDSQRTNPYRSIAKELAKGYRVYQKQYIYYQTISGDNAPISYVTSTEELVLLTTDQYAAIAEQLYETAHKFQDHLCFTATRELLNSRLRDAFGGDEFYVTVEIDESSRPYVQTHTIYDDQWKELGNKLGAYRLPLQKSKKKMFGKRFTNICKAFVKQKKGKKQQHSNLKQQKERNKNTNIFNFNKNMNKTNIQTVQTATAVQSSNESINNSINIKAIASILPAIYDGESQAAILLRLFNKTQEESIKECTGGQLTCTMSGTTLTITAVSSGTSISFTTEGKPQEQLALEIERHLRYLLGCGATATHDTVSAVSQTCVDCQTDGTSADQTVTADTPEVGLSGTTSDTSTAGLSNTPSYTSTPTFATPTMDATTSTAAPVYVKLADGISSASQDAAPDVFERFNTTFSGKLDWLREYVRSGETKGQRRQRLHAQTAKMALKCGYDGKKSKDGIFGLLTSDNKRQYDIMYDMTA